MEFKECNKHRCFGFFAWNAILYETLKVIRLTLGGIISYVSSICGSLFNRSLLIVGFCSYFLQKVWYFQKNWKICGTYGDNCEKPFSISCSFGNSVFNINMIFKHLKLLRQHRYPFREITLNQALVWWLDNNLKFPFLYVD